PGRRDLDALKDLVELVEHGLGQGVDAAVGAVQSQHQDAVVAQFGFPVQESQSVKHRLWAHIRGSLVMIPAGWHDGKCRLRSDSPIRRNFPFGWQSESAT